MSQLTLLDFLPAYSHIDTNKDDPLFAFYPDKVPTSDQKEFYPSVFLKKEFYDAKLPSLDPPRKDGEPFKPLGQQTFISRFLSEYTQNDKLLLVHGLGTGKSCTASIATELAKSQNPNLAETLFLVRSSILKDNITEEIANVCTGGKYIPNLIDAKSKRPLTSKQYVRRLNANMRKSYVIETFERFASYLTGLSDEEIKRSFSNIRIVIDEAHNLRLQPKETTVSIYTQFHRFLHLVENCKIILMTGTPMRDRVKELAGLLNQLLALDKQIGPEFFDGNALKEDMIPEFKERIRGLISFVREMNSDVKKIYEPSAESPYDRVPNIKLKLVQATMSDFQTKYYLNAYKKDKSSGDDVQEGLEEDDEDLGKGIWKNSRHAAMFVSPNGKWGDDLEPEWYIPSVEDIDRRTQERKSKDEKRQEKEAKEEKKRDREEKGNESSKNEKTIRPLNDRIGRASSKLKKWIYNDKENPSVNERLERLAILSPKFAGAIAAFIDTKDKAFVYSNLVEGGTNLFVAILELFGYKHIRLPEDGESRVPDLNKYKGEKQYLLITGRFPTSKQANYLINRVFNHKENKYGDYIQVIVASKVVGEGSSFKAARQFHALSPGWNFTEIAQAQGRVLRAFAHDVFDNIAEKYERIFLWCTMPSNPKDFSIDLYMYKLSEDKDFPIKRAERVLKEVAIDCALNVKRNMRPSIDADGTRECDYTYCIYKCQDIPFEWYQGDLEMGENNHPDLIVDSYNLYYADSQIANIKSRISILYKDRFIYDFYELNQLFNDITKLILIRALKEMIDQNTPILNKYGIMSYLRESNNLYFLVDNSEFKHRHNMFLLSEYNSRPVLKEKLSFEDYTLFFEYKYIDSKLKKLSSLNIREIISTDIGKDELELTFRSFDPDIQEKLLESFVQAEEENIKVNEPLRTVFLNTYNKNFLFNVGNKVISILLYEDKKGHNKDNIRCYDKRSKKWSSCNEEEIKQAISIIESKKSVLKTDNPYGYYGVKDKDGKFKIVTLRTGKNIYTAKGEIDKRVVKSKGEGTVCGTGDNFNLPRMTAILLRIGEIADERGDQAPSNWDLLSEKNRSEIRAGATPKNVIKLFNHLVTTVEGTKKIKKKKKDEAELQILPEVDEADINNFSKEKLERWYALMMFASKDKLCPTFENWFRMMGYFEQK
jgi:superfamily II DNA or RNA helicase